jgi:hypothetical protein
MNASATPRSEGVEERVAFVVDLVALAEGGAHHLSVPCKSLPVFILVQFLHEPRRRLDVREHERHATGRLLSHDKTMNRARASSECRAAHTHRHVSSSTVSPTARSLAEPFTSGRISTMTGA